MSNGTADSNPTASIVSTDIEHLLSKYVHVWLWSILFGATTALTYSFMGLGMLRTLSGLNAVFVALALFGVLAALGAWLSLYDYLDGFLIPAFLPAATSSDATTAPSDGGAREVSYANLTARRKLRWIFGFLMMGSVARLVITMSELFSGNLR
jgi:hypothetical protein